MNEFAKFCTNVSYFLNRPLTTEDVLFDVMDGFDAGKYAEEVAENLSHNFNAPTVSCGFQGCHI